MANTAKSLISVAKAEIGVKESPAGSNKQKYGKWYGMNGQPWCDIFVSWVAAKAGVKGIGKYCYCPSHVKYFKSAGRWYDRDKEAKVGDIIFFGNKGTACHVGIIIEISGSGSSRKFTTIEGNTSKGNNANGGQVQKRVRTMGTKGSSWYVYGFGRPAYDTLWGYKTSAVRYLYKHAKSTKKERIVKIPVDGKMKYLGKKSGNWRYVEYNGKKGWVYRLKNGKTILKCIYK